MLRQFPISLLLIKHETYRQINMYVIRHIIFLNSSCTTQKYLVTFTVASRHFCVRIAVRRSLKPFRTCGSSLHRGGGNSTRAYFTNVCSAGTPFSCDTAVINTHYFTQHFHYDWLPSRSMPCTTIIRKWAKLNVRSCHFLQVTNL